MKMPALLPRSSATAKRRSAKAPVARQQSPPLRPVVPQAPIPLPALLKKKLLGLRNLHWRVATGTGVSILAVTVCLLVLGQGLADWLLDLPRLLRALLLVGDAVTIGVLYRRHLHTCLRHRLTLAQTALQVEKKWPELRQRVITAVELSEGTSQATRGSRQLVDLVIQQAAARTTNLNFKSVVPTRAFRRWLACAAISALLLAAIGIVTWPASFTLLERLVLVKVPLPTRTVVVPVTEGFTVPIGGDAEISALAKGIIPSRGRVIVSYGGMAPQEFPVAALPDKPNVFTYVVHNVQKDFKYEFFLNDGHGDEFPVIARMPPGITKLACEEIFPSYTQLPAKKLEPSDLSLLAGSHLRISATASEPLKSATLILQGLANQILVKIDASGTGLTADLPIPVHDLTGFSIHLLDKNGVPSTNETTYPVIIVPDEPPVLKLVEPVADEQSITLRAKPLIVFEASDDYGLSKLSFVYQVMPPAIAGGDAPPPLPAVTIPITLNAKADDPHYEMPLDLASLSPPWQEGWRVNYWIEAVDNNTETGPGITKTDPKSFVILSPEAKRAEVVKRIEEDASRLDDLSGSQQKIIDDVGETLPQK